MERFRLNNDNVIIVMIILTILVLLKAAFYFMSITNFKHIFISDENFEKFRNILTDIVDVFLMLIAFFILFLRKNNTIFATFLAILILFKGFVRFFIDFELYKYTNLSDNTVNNIKKYKKSSVFMTNIVLFIVTIYIIKTIFIK